jgi:hypothetical protein
MANPHRLIVERVNQLAPAIWNLLRTRQEDAGAHSSEALGYELMAEAVVLDAMTRIAMRRLPLSAAPVTKDLATELRSTIEDAAGLRRQA